MALTVRDDTAAHSTDFATNVTDGPVQAKQTVVLNGPFMPLSIRLDLLHDGRVDHT